MEFNGQRRKDRIISEMNFDVQEAPGERRLQLINEVFAGGYALVKKDGKYGFINREGELAVPAQYDLAMPLLGGYCWIGLDGKYGILGVVPEEPTAEEARAPGKEAAEERKDASTAAPENGDTAIVLTIGSTVVMRGELVLPEPPQAPCIVNGRTLLPFRHLIETLGGSAAIDEAIGVITAEIDGYSFEMSLDKSVMLQNGELFDLGQAPHMMNSVVMILLRAFERVVTQISWDGVSQTVMIVP